MLIESEAIHIIREAVACFRKPVLLYSIGKDSSVVLHLVRKAFWPAPPPMPLLHIDSGWEFREMAIHRDSVARSLGLELIVHRNKEAQQEGLNPFDHGSLYTEAMKTVALRQALDRHGFDCALGGARRDEEKSRAKERIFSLRAPGHRWDAKRQRPELWRAYNTRLAAGETMRVFPISNWTELDVWQYLLAEGIPIVPLYLAKPRPVVRRADTWIMVDDERMRLEPGERPEMRNVRFRTLGCYPQTGAVESSAATLEEVVAEMAEATTSERQGRLIDREQDSSMERKKQMGYF